MNTKKWILAITSALALVLIGPLLIRCFYSSAYFTSLNLNINGYTLEAILMYWGSALSFIGTISLGCVTVYLTHRANKTSESLMEIERNTSTPMLVLLTKPDIVPEMITNDESYYLIFNLKNINKISIASISAESEKNLFDEKELNNYEVQGTNIEPEKIETFSDVINGVRTSCDKVFKIIIKLEKKEFIPINEENPVEKIISFTIEIVDVFGNKRKQNFLVSGCFYEVNQRLRFVNMNYLSKFI